MDTKGISKLDLKRRNRRQILLAIRNAGMLARVDIAAQLSLTRAAVTIITNQMIAQGILEDMNTPAIPAPDAPRKKGRRKTMIRINPNYRFVLGAVIDEDFVSVGLSNLADDVLDKNMLPIQADTPKKTIISFIVQSCRDMLKKSSLSPDNLLGLGIGIVRDRWENIGASIAKDGSISFNSLRETVEQELKLPVFCGNAVGLYAMANTDYLDKKHRNQLLLYSGTSYQTAVIHDSTLLGGLLADTTTVDRMIVWPGGAKAEGYPDGSVHAELTKDALCRQMKEETGKDVNVEELIRLYLQNDAAALRIVNNAVQKLAYMIYNLAAIHSANRVVLQSYHIADSSMELLEQLVADINGTAPKVSLVRSSISGDRSFLAGCKLITEKQFYDLGGMPQNQNAE